MISDPSDDELYRLKVDPNTGNSQVDALPPDAQIDWLHDTLSPPGVNLTSRSLNQRQALTLPPNGFRYLLPSFVKGDA